MNARILLIADDTTPDAAALLARQPDFEVVGTWADWWRGLVTLGETEVDLSVIDISRPGFDAELVIRRFKQRNPFLKIIALVDDRDRAGLRLAESGVVTDHVTRSNISTELVGTVRRALGGLSLSRRRWAGRVSGTHSTVELLTTSGGADLLA